MQCPECNLENPPNSSYCDCGYEFADPKHQAVPAAIPHRVDHYPNAVQWRILWSVATVVCVGLLVMFDGVGFMIDAVIIGGLLYWRYSGTTHN